MKQSKSHVAGCRLTDDVLEKAEKIALIEGDKNVNALMKRLLLERLAQSEQSVRSLDQNEYEKIAKSQMLQMHAIENVRSLILTGFEAVFEATGSSNVFKSAILSLQDNWQALAEAFNENISATPKTVIIGEPPMVKEQLSSAEGFTEIIDQMSGEKFLIRENSSNVGELRHSNFLEKVAESGEGVGVFQRNSDEADLLEINHTVTSIAFQ